MVVSLERTPAVITMEDIPEYDKEDYDLFNPKEFRKYLGDVKKDVRNSLEYRRLVQYLKQNMDMNECSFFKNINATELSKIKIELHHSPFTLEDIVLTVYNKRSFYGESLDVEDVAEEVVYIHYFIMVGLIPLSTTVHELVHSQNIFIPCQDVFGDYKEFMDIYKSWMDPELIEKIEAIEDKSKTFDNELNMNLLQQTMIPINMIDNENRYMVPALEDMNSIMSDKLKEIRNSNSHALTDNTYDNNINFVRGMVYEEEPKPNLIRGMMYDAA